MALSADLKQSLVIPAVCAPMSVVTGPALVREACKAGIMGGLPRHNAESIEQFEQWLSDIRAALDQAKAENPDATIGPLAVNMAGRATVQETRAELDLCARYGVNVIISALGDPTELTKVVHDWGGQVFHDATNIRFAEKALRAGVDGITCVVSGGGGHSGPLNPLVLIPYIRSIFDGTIVMAGTVSNGAAVRAAEILGADLAYLGTRFIATRESNVPDAYKQMLVTERSSDLIFSERVSGVAANWMKASLRSHGLDPDDLPRSVARGNYDHLPPDVRPWRDIWSAGQGIELINDVPTVAELVARLREEYRAACAIPFFRG
jgi:nitronate monooxygenase